MSTPQFTPLVEVHELQRFYRRPLRRRHIALDRVTCALRPGVVNALLGHNGAGKTTLLHILLGQLRLHGGQLRWRSPRPSCRYLPENGFLEPSLSATAWAPALGTTQAQLAAMANQLGVDHLRHRPARTLSRGERRRCELALVLAGPAELYVLDEPAAGLDPLHLEYLKAVVASLVQKGSTVLLSTHLLREWENSVGHVVLLHRGRVLLEEELAALLARHRLWVPTTASPPPLPREAFPLPGRAVAPAHVPPPSGWSVQPATLADVFLKETADDRTPLRSSDVLPPRG